MIEVGGELISPFHIYPFPPPMSTITENLISADWVEGVHSVVIYRDWTVSGEPVCFKLCVNEEELQSALWELTLNDSTRHPWPLVRSQEEKYDNYAEKSHQIGRI